MGAEEEPGQTETRQRFCFRAESPSVLAPLPTSANFVTSSVWVLKTRLGGPCGYSRRAPLRPEGPTWGSHPEQAVKEQWFLQEVWTWWLSGSDGARLAWALSVLLADLGCHPPRPVGREGTQAEPDPCPPRACPQDVEAGNSK